MDARRLQAITVSPEQVVLKRGVHELLVSGADAAPIVDTLLAALRRAGDVDEVLLYTPDQHRAAIEQLIRSLRARRLIDDAPPPAPDVRDAAQWAFFGALDADPVTAQATLRDATVTVLGL